VIIASLAVTGFSLVVDWQTRELPNYTRIEDGLYLGGCVPEPPSGTRAVLNLCEFDDSYRPEVYRWRAIPDAAPAPTLDWLRQQVEFIDEQRRAGRPVFVHCYAGVSRSALVTTAYLMRRNGWSRDQALQFLQSRREVVRPNAAFLLLLLEWEAVVRRGATLAPPSRQRLVARADRAELSEAHRVLVMNRE
jgi:protein-tyrosine phosphatase